VSIVDRIARAVTEHSAAVVVVVLLLTAGLGAGMGGIEQSSDLGQFQSDSTESQKLNYIEDSFQTGGGNATQVQVVVRDDNVLSNESLVSQLRLIKRFQTNETVSATLSSSRPPTGVANLVAQAAIRQQAGAQAQARPTIDQQIAAVEAMNQSQIDAIVTQLLGGDGNGGMAIQLMPTSYTPGSTSAEATMISVAQTTVEEQAAGGSASDRLVNSQLAMQSLVHEELGTESSVFGSGIIADEINRSMSDSILVVGPMALVFVLFVLIVAYRDLLDILLGLFGIGAVLVWTFGFMGWAGFAFNQLFVAIPVLLIGLSIDYAIHVFMRHREERDRTEGVGKSMAVALASVGVALFFVTATTVIGFLSNLISEIPPIRQFGIVAAWGIVAAFVIFGALIPAMKSGLDSFLEARGYDRQKRAFGTGGGAIGSALAFGETAARRAPIVVLLLTLVLTSAGAYGATQVDTSFAQEDFLADDPPDWMESLPEPFAPGEYHAKESLNFVYENFPVGGSQGQTHILIEDDGGGLTESETLHQMAAVHERATSDEMDDAVVILSSGQADIQSPLAAMQRVAAENETFAQAFTQADPDQDGVPEENVEGLYDQLYATAPQQAAGVLNITDGNYQAAQMIVSVQGTASGGEQTSATRALAEEFDSEGLTVTATGQPIVFKMVSDSLLSTVVNSLLITLVAVFGFLMITYRITDGSATLGFVTLLPVAFSVAWILGTMALFGIPFNVLTGMITSLTVGLGVAYSIHISERYAHELERQDDVWTAMRTTVTGTGGALLGSAATTVGGFGVLAFAILPPLQQFGIITGLTIIYAFLASVLVLPTLLVYWTRYLGPDDIGGDGDEEFVDEMEWGAEE